MLRISYLGQILVLLTLAAAAQAQDDETANDDAAGAVAAAAAGDAANAAEAASAPATGAETVAEEPLEPVSPAADAERGAGESTHDADANDPDANDTDANRAAPDASLLDQVVPVAEEESDSGTSPTDDATTADEPLTEDVILAEFARYQRLIGEQAWDEADTAAKRVVQMAIRYYGPESLETAKALNNLAVVQHSQGQYDAAIQNFTSSIEILEDVENRLSDKLVNPLKGLGAAQLGSGRPDLAANSFGRAVHITQVNEGPHNLDQVELLESLAESNMRMGEVKAANELLERIHIINVRHFANDAMGLLPSLMRRAEWQKNAGFQNEARSTYRRAIRIIEDELGNDDPQLIAPLLALAETYYYVSPLEDSTRQYSMSISGETYFKRAVRIAELHPELPWLDLANARLALADYYTFTNSPNRAAKIYSEVWETLSADEDRLEIRKGLMEWPIAVIENPLPIYLDGGAQAATGAPTGDFLRGTVRVVYTVSSQGAISELRSEVTPTEFDDMLRTVHREIRSRAFRPMHVDGEAVNSPEIVFEHTFYYQDADLQRVRDKLAAAATTQ